MKLFTIFTIMLISITSVKGQHTGKQQLLIVKEGKQYLYNENLYSVEDLGPIFYGNEDLLFKYSDAMKSLKKGKILGYTSLGAFGVGLLSVAVNPSDAAICDNCWSDGLLIGVVAIGLVTPITGTIALLSHFKGKGKMKKLIHSFNEKEYDALGRVIEQPKLNFASSGVGISIMF